MKLWNNLKICGAYFIYLFIFLWMLAKEFLGYQVDWSWCPPFTLAERNQEKQETNSHSSYTIRHGVHGRSKDLEANLNSAHSASTVILEDSEKTINREKPNNGCDMGHFVIYEAHPIKATSDAVTDGQLTSQVLSPPPPPALSKPQGQQQTLTEAKGSSTVHFNAPTVAQLDGKNTSHVNSNLEGLIAKVFKDPLRDHQQSEEATTSRLNFVKGLKYIENNNFKFPAIVSALRVKSIKPKRAHKKSTLVNLSPSTIPPIVTTRPSTKPEVSAIFTTTPTISELKQPTPALDKSPSSYPPSLSLSPVQTSSASSTSSYSSTYTIVESSYTDLTTPTDEDIPINFNCTLPSWRRDPDRAKTMFGSLARSAADSNISEVDNDQGYLMSNENSKAQGERTGPTEDTITSRHQVVQATEEDSHALKNPRLKSMILAMGLSPLPTASTLHSDSGTTGDKGETQHRMQPGSEQYDDGADTGLVTPLIDTVMSRESVISDLLFWVESSSSIGFQ